MSKKKIILIFFIISGAIWFIVSDNESFESNSFTSTYKKQKAKREISSTPIKKTVSKNNKRLLATTPIVTYKSEQKLVDRKITSTSKIKKISNKPARTVGDHLILENYFAVIDSKENRQRFDKFERKLGYLFVRGQMKPMDAVVVTQNKDSGALGIMTGVLTVKLYDFSEYQNLIDHSNFSISQLYDHIKVVHYRIDSSELAISTYESLKGHPNIQRMSLEILEYSRFHR